MIPLVIASTNKGKLREMAELLRELPFQLILLSEKKDPPQVVEDGMSFAENARKKASEFAIWSGQYAIADDSGLCVDALNGAPGIYSARYAGENGSDADNNAKLLREIVNVPEAQRGAHYECAIAVADPKGEIIGEARGQCAGLIAHDMRGTGGFGYDVLFTDLITGKRFAELSADEKHSRSHRGKALREARNILERVALSQQS